MRLLITGGTGFIGAPLCQTLVQHGHELLVISRSPTSRPAYRANNKGELDEAGGAQVGVQYLSWDTDDWQRAMAGVEGVINLAGESIASKRWSPRQKVLIRESRVHTTQRLVTTISTLPKKPTVFLSASAVGYYGDRGDEELAETDSPGNGFLAKTCQAWEAEAQRAETFGMRVARLRLGLVLGPQGGALAKMVPPFRFFLGGPLGSGRQWVSWIHRDDVIGLVEWILAHPAVCGAVNATAPQPVTMQTLCHELGRALHRPSWAPVPAVALRLLLGEMAGLLLTGQRVVPVVALQGGYMFQFSELPHALEACLRP